MLSPSDWTERKIHGVAALPPFTLPLDACFIHHFPLYTKAQTPTPVSVLFFMRSFARATLFGMVFVLALTWIGGIDVLRISASEVGVPSTALDEFKTLEKTWTVASTTGLRMGSSFSSVKPVQPSVATSSSKSRALVNDDAAASISVDVLGSGDVFVASTEKLSVGGLSVRVAHSGDVQVQVPLIEVGSVLSEDTHGCGDVAVLADVITANEVKNQNSGSADVYAQANSLRATNIDTWYMCRPEYDSDWIGRRSYWFHCLATVRHAVHWSGDARVQVTEKLVATLTGSGSIKYVSDPPAQLIVNDQHPTKHKRHSLHGNKVTQARSSSYETYRADHLPSRTPQLFIVHPSNDWTYYIGVGSSEGNVVIIDDKKGYNGWELSSALAVTVQFPAKCQSGYGPLAAVGIVMGIAVVAAARRFANFGVAL
ncbi:hypothetical protein FI667_g14254, partial [Globisporangium splendens]